MSGLIQRDLLLYFRKNPKILYVFEAVYFLFFLFIMKNKYGPLTYLLLCTPIDMSGLPATLKEMDTSYKGMMTARLLPYSKKDLVKGRFYSAFSYHIFSLAEMLLFTICHQLSWKAFSLEIYFLLFLGGWLIGILLTAVNLLDSLHSGINATRIFYMISAIGLVGGYLLFLFSDKSYDFLNQLISTNRVLLFLLGIFVNILIVLVCYFISLKHFEKSS